MFCSLNGKMCFRWQFVVLIVQYTQCQFVAPKKCTKARAVRPFTFTHSIQAFPALTYIHDFLIRFMEGFFFFFFSFLDIIDEPKRTNCYWIYKHMLENLFRRIEKRPVMHCSEYINICVLERRRQRQHQRLRLFQWNACNIRWTRFGSLQLTDLVSLIQTITLTKRHQNNSHLYEYIYFKKISTAKMKREQFFILLQVIHNGFK